MGKIVAIGGGAFHDKDSVPIINHIMTFFEGKSNLKMVFLPTAAFDNHGDEELVKEFFGNLGFSATSLYLSDETLTDDYIRETILGADLIYADGGNLKFLMETWRKTGADKYLRQAHENGTVLAGQSSGAMCWFERGFDDCGLDGRYMFIDCVGILPGCLCPHFENDGWHSFTEAVKMQELDGIGVDNFTALSCVDGEYSVIKADPDPNNSVFLMPAKENYILKDLAKM